VTEFGISCRKRKE